MAQTPVDGSLWATPAAGDLSAAMAGGARWAPDSEASMATVLPAHGPAPTGHGVAALVTRATGEEPARGAANRVPMAETRAQRTLVKSPPELWAEVSDLEALARHLGEFGEIRITRLEPETAVAWEGDRVRGTVQLEPSGWGTKVTLTADVPDGGEAADRAEAIPTAAEASPPEGADARAARQGEGRDGEADAEPRAGAREPRAGAREPRAGAREPRAGAREPGSLARDDRPASLFGRLFGRLRRRPEVTGGADEPEPAAAEPSAAKEGDCSDVVEATVWADGPAEPSAAKEGASSDVDEAPVGEPPAGAGEPPAGAPAATAERGIDSGRAEAILTEVLDDLGSARHRPFSRLG